MIKRVFLGTRLFGYFFGNEKSNKKGPLLARSNTPGKPPKFLTLTLPKMNSGTILEVNSYHAHQE